MKRYLLSILIVIIICFACINLYADIRGLVNEIDSLHYQYKHPEIIAIIESSLSKAGSEREKADLYWRLARATLYTGDMAKANGQPKKEVLALMKQAEELANQAIDIDPNNPAAYYWKSISIGNWGAEKGMLDSLFKAKPMKNILEDVIDRDPQFAEAYWVLGMLYEALPGAPLSFGNKGYAVSLGRKALDLHLQAVKEGKESRINYGIHKELAGQLYSRDWNVKKRKSEHEKMKSKYDAAAEIQDKKLYYEGSVTISNQSDQQEALNIVKRIISELEAKDDRTFYDNEDLTETRELLAEWSK